MTLDAPAGPTPARYFEHARATNEAARLTLRLDTRDASVLQAKISLGLSLQAAELAGKGMLRVLGVSAEEIRKSHGRHNVLELLQDVDSKVLKHENKALGSVLISVCEARARLFHGGGRRLRRTTDAVGKSVLKHLITPVAA